MTSRIIRLLLIAGYSSVVAASPLHAQTLAGGGSHTVVVKPDGTVWTFGANTYGQLGDSTTTQRTTPVQVSTLINITAVAAGTEHTLALQSDGTIWAWGRNANGQVGDGTTTNRTAPVIVAGLPPVTAIAAGAAHSVALALDGSIWVWGLNSNGQLGDGTTTRSLLPIIVATGWTAVAIGAGHAHTLAIRSDGTLWGWGANGSGQLGAATPAQWTLPAMVGGVTGAVAATGGSCHTAVLRSDGRVLASGCNAWGQLGNNTTTNRPSMDLVLSLEGVTTLRAGDSFNSALTTAGEVWSWGANLNGQTGSGLTGTQKLPVRTLTSGSVAHLAAGHTHGVAATTTGIVFTWGSNGSGRLGDGTTTQRTIPVAISDTNYVWKVATPTVSLAAGTYSTDQTVTVACATPGAELHYTVNGEDPTLAHPVIASGGSLPVDETMTLKVRAWKDGMAPSTITSATYTMVVALPAVSPGGGTYSTPPTVTVSTTTPNATLRYTTDNTTPTDSSPVYTAPLQITTTTTLKVIGFRTGWTNSSTRTATYTMNFGTQAPPEMSPAEGTYTSSVVVTLSALPGATIRYTTNGTTPNTFSPIYTAPLTVSVTQTIKAIAYHPDYTTSAVSTSVYTIQVGAPLFSPGGGSYPPGQSVIVSSETPGATIRYTLDGRDPTDSDPVIASGGTLVIGNYTLKARATKSGCAPSAITAATYQLSAALTTAQVDGGTGRSILVRPDGVVWSWGWQAGNGITAGSYLPIRPGSITGAMSASAGGTHMLLSAVDGTVYAWGTNINGQLGDATTTSRSTPVALGTISNVARVAAGGRHSVALKQDGTVWSWGINTQGQLGDGTTAQRTSPVAVSGLTGIVAIAAGEEFTLALKSNGTVWSWGDNTWGQLGDGTTTDRLQPVHVTGLSNVVAVSAGYGHALALRADGSVSTWGYNIYGQVGNGSTTPQSSPSAVAGLPSITAIAAGGFHSLALTAGGEIWAWGSNLYGSLGDGSTQNRLTPAPIAGLSGIAAIGAGNSHSLAIASDGTVWTWGRNADGELGDGTQGNQLLPVAISGPGYNWKVWTPTVTPASAVYTAVQSAVVTCPDSNATIHYSLDGSEPTPSHPAIVSGGSIPITVSTTLKVNAWKPGAPTSVTVVRAYELKAVPPGIAPSTGSYAGAVTVTLTNPNSEGTITYTVDGSQPTPESTAYSGGVLVGQTLTLKAVAHRPGWTSSDAAYASYWITDGIVEAPVISPAPGTYDTPQLVTISSATGSAAIRYTLDGSDPEATSPLYRHALVVSATTTVKARAFKPGMTQSAIAAATYLLDVPGAAATPVLAPAGGRFTVAQTVTIVAPPGATLRYTVDGRDPEDTDPLVGPERTIVVDRSMVLRVRAWEPGLDPGAVRSAFFVITGQVAAGYVHNLALKADGSVWSWGYNFYGMLGDGTNTNRLSPLQVGIGDVQAVAAGYGHSLALKRDGTVWAWGYNNCGQLGDNSTTNRSTPVQVSGLTGVVAIAGGGEDAGFAFSHSLALKADGTVWAWGCNQLGQLGDGTNTNRKTPVQVLGLQGVTAIAAGGRFSVAIEAAGGATGTVWVWGNGQFAALVDGATASPTIPVRLDVHDAEAIAAHHGGAMALRSDGTVWQWGGGSPKLSGMPTTPSGMPFMADILTIGVGAGHVFAIGRDGIRWGWGSNSSGQLGVFDWYVSSITALASNRVNDGSPATLQITGGWKHSALLRVDGTVACTGDNTYGQLGNGTTTASPVPGAVPGLSLVDNAWLAADVDQDGLTGWQEWLAGTDPYRADTNGNGILDGIEALLGSSGANPDTDGDGLANWIELLLGTDPFVADTDGDGVVDGLDAFPLDPTQSSLPPPNPADTTPPIITLTEPTTAVPVGGGGGL